ncbi:MAG: hypothetical protein M1827_006690 [Pycnora praestabilis]|nr:MAG: hypothetical protein M1827_006690 [Pycnora praestabilis]
MEINVLGVIYTTNVFLPLLKQGKEKKIVMISTGLVDPKVVEIAGLSNAITYSLSKVAVNMVATKYAIQFKSENITVVAMSPGYKRRSPLLEMPFCFLDFVFGKLIFKEKISPKESVRDQLKTIAGLTIEDTGKFMSQHGSTQWL